MQKITVHIRPPHINWHKYITRRVIILGAVIIILDVLAYYAHIHIAARGGEFALGTLLEHWIFGVPIEEVAEG